MSYYKITFGDEEQFALGDTLDVTPEWIAMILKDTPRPEGYQEGDVRISLSLTDLASLFGSSNVESVTKEEWHDR